MSRSTTRLWDKGGTLDEAVLRFTVGDDPTWDKYLVHWDCLGSAAHARTLERAGLLSTDDATTLIAGLARIDARAHAGDFDIPVELEDCHTTIEAELTRECGEAGERIHAGRSRNDQIATAMRLFMRDAAAGWLDLLGEFVEATVARAASDGDTAMPGYTHMQPAMPSSVGCWLHAFAEAGLEQVHATTALVDRLDRCPLGTGAGYGVPLPLDRAYTAELLGFACVQRSAIDVQNSRGRLERAFVQQAMEIGGVLEKLCCDLLLFTTAEFGFFELPESLTTGSSIMPQKRNPDVVELLRARGARLRARVVELDCVSGKLPSGYQRDLQLTKEPAIRTAIELGDMLHIAKQVVREFRINTVRLAAAMRPELYATHAALELTRGGTPFREAYRQIAAEIRAGSFDDARVAVWRDDYARVSTETLAEIHNELATARQREALRRERITTAETSLLPQASANECD